MEQNRCCHLEQSYLSSFSPGSCSVPLLSCSFFFPPSLFCHNTPTNQTVSVSFWQKTEILGMDPYQIIIFFYILTLVSHLNLAPSFGKTSVCHSMMAGWLQGHRDTPSYRHYHRSHHVISLCNSNGLPCLQVSQWPQQHLGFDINTHQWHTSGTAAAAAACQLAPLTHSSPNCDVSRLNITQLTAS